MPPRSLTLAIETSNPSAWEPSIPTRPGIAIIEGLDPASARTLAVESIDPAQRHDDDLMPAIDRAVRAAGLKPTDLTRIAVSSGPGGFTAVRMAITLAKTIADTTSAACIPVPSALIPAAAITHDAPFAVALASKDNSTYLTTFNPDHTIHTPGRIITEADISSLNITLLLADRFLPEPIRRAALAHKIAIQLPIFDPILCAKVSLTLPAIDPAHVVPIYPRPPEAVRKWKELHPQPVPPSSPS